MLTPIRANLVVARRSPWRRRALTVALAAVVLAPAAMAHDRAFVRASSRGLKLDDQPFRFAGANTYYLINKSQYMVDDVLTTAAAQGFRVLRTWGSLEIGNQDDTSSIKGDGKGKQDGVYFHYWNGTAPAFNDGPDGLERLDYVIFRAGQLGIKLVIPFVNNWDEYGGMDQYVRWRGGTFHDEFYTDELVRSWYRDWIAHVLEHVNTLTGVAYKDDPTVLGWELGNEPRCKAGLYGASSACTAQVLVEWADQMSRYVKSIDHHHLVSVGDEGFYCDPLAADWTENCGEGVDTLAFTRLPSIDVMSFHMYVEDWGKTVDWGSTWIRRHIADARRIGKPAVLGEVGVRDKLVRNVTFHQWTQDVLTHGGAGVLHWMLAGNQDGGTRYPDYDGFAMYCPGPLCQIISRFGEQMAADRSIDFAPVVDDLVVETPFGSPVTLDPLSSAVAYGCASVVATSLDLDPATPGAQTVWTTPRGTFAVAADQRVVFTPLAGVSGIAQATYAMADARGQRSNAGTLTVTTLPDPNAPVLLVASFEDGTEGWAPASWQPLIGTTSSSAGFASEGTQALRIDTLADGWFGVVPPKALNLQGRPHLKFDIRATNAGTSQNIAIKTGASYVWCQGPWGYLNPGTTTAIDIDLTQLTCDATAGAPPDLSDVRELYLFFSAGGTFYIDNVRAQ